MLFTEIVTQIHQLIYITLSYLKEPIYKDILMLFHHYIVVYFLHRNIECSFYIYISVVVTDHEVELDEVTQVIDSANMAHFNI